MLGKLQEKGVTEEQISDSLDKVPTDKYSNYSDAVVKYIEENPNSKLIDEQLSAMQQGAKDGKSVDEIVEKGKELNNLSESQIQKKIIDSVENGQIKLETNIQKGNYGEMKMDQYFESQGYERISTDRVTDLNEPTHQGIYGVYYKSGPPEEYIVAEAKYGSSRLSTLSDGTKQMSEAWIEGGKSISRLEASVGKDVADDILLEGYNSILTQIDPNGNVTISSLDANGDINK